MEPLRILFLSFLEEGAYPDDWKKSNVVPIQKNKSKNLIKNYRPISEAKCSFLTLRSVT